MEDKLTNEMGGAVERARAQLSDAAQIASNTVVDMGRHAASMVDAARLPAAESMQEAATAIHQKADSLPGGPRVQSAAHAVAGKLGEAAGYVRTHNMSDAVAEVDRTVRRYPGQALVAALCVGFLAGRLLRPTQS